MTQNLSSGFKFHNGQMTGLYVQLTFLMQLAIGMLQMTDNTFGEGFDWENAPWFDANGLNDVALCRHQQ